MKLGRAAANVSIPALALRLGWRSVGAVYAGVFAVAALAWQLAVKEQVAQVTPARLGDLHTGLLVEAEPYRFGD